MNVCTVQPPYSTDYTQSDRYFQWELDAFDHCNESMDLIVFPESSATPCMAHSAEELRSSYDRYFHRLMDKAHANGIMCNVFWSDDPVEAKQLLEMGIGTILTNDYHRISQTMLLK